MGTSAGGLAGVAASAAPDTRVDFIVLESPLIDWPPGTKVHDCARAKGQTTDRLFGLRDLAGGGCAAGSTGILDIQDYRSIPVFLLQGAKDLRTPAVLADAWVARARAGGACITRVSAVAGGHTLASWPKLDQDRGRQALREWISTIGSPQACPSTPRPQARK